jgi:hypothetical protein
MGSGDSLPSPVPGQNIRQSQFTGKKKSYRPSPGDDDVVGRLMLIVTQQELQDVHGTSFHQLWNDVL